MYLPDTVQAVALFEFLKKLKYLNLISFRECPFRILFFAEK